MPYIWLTVMWWYEMILSKARKEHKCDTCQVLIERGSMHLVKQRYGYGSDRYCIICVMAEIGVVFNGKK